MSKKEKFIKALRHQRSRERYELKRRRHGYRKRRYNFLLARRIDIDNRRKIERKKDIYKIAPNNFSFIDNTDEVVGYINECKSLLHSKEKVIIDIKDVDNITPDAIALLAACANEPSFSGKYGKLSGNAPKDEKLLKMFVESGFYSFVNSYKIMKLVQKTDDNMLHKESHFQVQPDIAKKACLYGTKHVFSNEKPFPDLYEMIVEAMSNTNNHANKEKDGTTKWWLYTYNDPTGKTCYSFVDLGVGIFDSIPVGMYKKVKMKLGISHNSDLVQDLLDGKIKSKVTLDNKMRGKGIPQIAKNSAKDTFGKAYIVSNDVKIDLKTRTSVKLLNNFQGTFLYWELVNNNII